MGEDARVVFVRACLLVAVSSATGWHQAVAKVVRTFSRESSLGSHDNFTRLASNYGYVSEEHAVVTGDGYVLTVFRIPRGRRCRGPARQPPVLLVPGLLLTSESWLDSGPAAGLPFLLSDACYDVWCANLRGTYHGRRHLRLDPDADADFWVFSSHEMGARDVPATVDYVLRHTGAARVGFVGYSLGGRLLLVACAEAAGCCDRIGVAVLLAPAVFAEHSTATALRLVAQYYADVEPSLRRARELEIAHRGGAFQRLASAVCRDDFVAAAVCCHFFDILDTYHRGSFSTETLKRVFVHYPGGTSVRTLALLGQNWRVNRFQKYDYGPDGNLAAYGSVRPPLYDLNRTEAPVVLIYGRGDRLVPPADVEQLARSLPHVLETYEVRDPLWTHFDNCYGRHTKRFVLPKIIEYLEKYSGATSA